MSSRAKKKEVLPGLRADESARVLHSLLERHPELVAEAEAIACATVTEVDVEAIANNVEHVVLSLEIDDLDTRAGRRSGGYVEPTEAAWQLLEEAVDPFLEEMKRHVELGFAAAAKAACAGIVLGLYRCRGKNSDQVLGRAGDFPGETALHAVTTLARESSARHGLAWQLPDAAVDQALEWAGMIGRASKSASRKR